MKRDGRSLAHETLEEMRLRAVASVKAGEKPSAVMKAFGFCRTTVYRWLRAQEEGGEDALRSSKHPGPPSKLSAKQKKQVLNQAAPRQLGG